MSILSVTRSTVGLGSGRRAGDRGVMRRQGAVANRPRRTYARACVAIRRIPRSGSCRRGARHPTPTRLGGTTTGRHIHRAGAARTCWAGMRVHATGQCVCVCPSKCTRPRSMTSCIHAWTRTITCVPLLRVLYTTVRTYRP